MPDPIESAPQSPPIGTVLGESLHGPRWRHVEQFMQLPHVHDIVPSADPTQTELMRLFGANRDWELIGTNAANGEAAFHHGGGIKLTTGNSNGDELVLVPRSGGGTHGTPSRLWWQMMHPPLRPRFATRLVITEAITENTIIAVGLNNFRGVNGGAWHALFRVESGQLMLSQRNNGPTTEHTLLELDDVLPGSEFELAIEFDRDGRAHLLVSDIGGDRARRSVFVSEPMDADAALAPVMGLRRVTADTPSMIVRHVELGAGYAAYVPEPGGGDVV